MNTVEIIAKKRDGFSLTPDELAWMVNGYVQSRIPDYQMSAFLMAVVLRGMDSSETLSLTQNMIASGGSIDLSGDSGVKVDKHSTGGVGDKISLILAPLVACAGVAVPMMAGRGLGHTGGTLDKLESIPGFRTQLSRGEFIGQLFKIGCVIAGQTEDLVPADKKMYALRDVTATVTSIPLICASILSKKKAEGTNALVLDVKSGRGAFFPIREKTLELACALVRLGNDLGVKTEAVMTRMDQPLGNTVGNWLEVRESVEALQGKGPADLMEVVFALGGMMLMLADQVRSIDEGIERLRPILQSGRAWEKFLIMVKSQGGDIRYLENPDRYPKPACVVLLESPASGFVSGVDAMQAGLLSVVLGAGREKKEDEVDPAAGIVFRKKTGDRVKKGDVLAEIHTHHEQGVPVYRKRLLEAYVFSKTPVTKPKMIDCRIDAKGKIRQI